MRIVMPGGSGQVGRILARHFQGCGHTVTVLSRRPGGAPWRTVQWDGLTPGAWVAELEQSDVCINLAGQSVNCRYGARLAGTCDEASRPACFSLAGASACSCP